MLAQLARLLNDNIDHITRKWVDELRHSQRTEVHKHLLTGELVGSMKVMLANLASAIASREVPEHETPPSPDINGVELSPTPANTSPKLESAAQAVMFTTKPLGGPLQRAMQAAARLGELRQTQGYELHEVILEYAKLRQAIWSVLGAYTSGGASLSNGFLVEFARYLDMLLDELMLTTIENYYNASIRDLERRAIHDPLTQLYNSDYFRLRLQEEVRRAQRHMESVTVAMIDMDSLKAINDTYGHQVGDAVISAVAAAIRNSSRQSDVPCRYGGDEFAVILPETTKQQGLAFAERLLRQIRSLTVKIEAGAKTVTTVDSEPTPGKEGAAAPIIVHALTVSIGLASFPEDGRTPEMLIAKADAALYRAKRSGRDRVSL
jgi:diguanylate cyclase (GGDEF)-like protein